MLKRSKNTCSKEQEQTHNKYIYTYIKWGKQNVIKNTILKLHNQKNILLNTYCGSTINNSKKTYLPNYISQNITLQNPI